MNSFAVIYNNICFRVTKCYGGQGFWAFIVTRRGILVSAQCLPLHDKLHLSEFPPLTN